AFGCEEGEPAAVAVAKPGRRIAEALHLAGGGAVVEAASRITVAAGGGELAVGMLNGGCAVGLEEPGKDPFGFELEGDGAAVGEGEGRVAGEQARNGDGLRGREGEEGP